VSAPSPARRLRDAVGPDLDPVVERLDVWSNLLVALGGAPPDPAKRASG
jgi:hypothetical protein